MYRLFIAIDPPAQTRDILVELCYGLPEARWVDESRMHLTLLFLGEVDGARFRDARDLLAGLSVEPFELTLKNVGFFPPRKEPEILWAGVEPSDELLHLQKKIEGRFSRNGFKLKGRKFAPHIRLATVKYTPSAKVAGYLVEHSLFKSPPFEVEEVRLYSSYLSSERAIHQVESAVPLWPQRRAI